MHKARCQLSTQVLLIHRSGRLADSVGPTEQSSIPENREHQHNKIQQVESANDVATPRCPKKIHPDGDTPEEKRKEWDTRKNAHATALVSRNIAAMFVNGKRTAAGDRPHYPSNGYEDGQYPWVHFGFA